MTRTFTVTVRMIAEDLNSVTLKAKRGDALLVEDCGNYQVGYLPNSPERPSAFLPGCFIPLIPAELQYVDLVYGK